eukprot:m.191060 g.191060  ORF g.191060 m.191060 type:complete len:199 (+) comp18583_c1_seq1:333-929(+)
MGDSREAEHRDVKLCLLGRSGVGKSSIVLRFISDRFDATSPPTIGASYAQKDVNTRNNGIVRFKIWDTAGQEKFRGLAPMYFRGSEAAILVYDTTSVASFEELKFWTSELRKQTSGSIVLAVAGNKADLPSKVDVEEAMAYAESINASFILTSAKTSENVTDLFSKIANKLPVLASSPTGQPGTVNLLGGADEKKCAC